MTLIFKILANTNIQVLEDDLNKFSKEHEHEIGRDNLIYVYYDRSQVAVAGNMVQTSVLLCWEDRISYTFNMPSSSSLQGKNITNVEEYEAAVNEAQVKKESAVIETLDKLIFLGDCTDKDALLNLFNNIEGIKQPWVKYMIDEKIKQWKENNDKHKKQL